MIYRILVDEDLGIPEWWFKRRSVGLMGSLPLSRLMTELGVPYPTVENLRARFYFTERGWRRFGTKIAGEARRLGHVVKCVRRKNPLKSQVVYRDEVQVAILPARFTKGRTREPSKDRS